MKPKLIMSVSNDICTDQRVDKTCNVFTKENYEVILVGILRPKSQNISIRKYKIKRLKLCFKKNIFFYAELQIRLFFYLLFKKCDILYANDLDTLLPNFLIHKIKQIPLIYDSHEYFTEVPELKQNTFAKKTWERLEKCLFPHLKNVITVCDSIADIYTNKYKIPIHVIRNVPTQKTKAISSLKTDLKIAEATKIILYQGAINIDRGIEEAIEAMLFLENCILLIVGDGDILQDLKQKTKALSLSNKVIFTGRIPLEKLMDYTSIADLGISLEKDSNLNYKYCLPNKLFDYIQAEIPVLVSPLIEMQNIIQKYTIGSLLRSHNPAQIAMQIQEIFNDQTQYSVYVENTKKAKKILCWEEEQKIVKNIIENLK
ncbi:MAG: glycosyltransferase [Bacteroidales bacterium]